MSPYLYLRNNEFQKIGKNDDKIPLGVKVNSIGKI